MRMSDLDSYSDRCWKRYEKGRENKKRLVNKVKDMRKGIVQGKLI